MSDSVADELVGIVREGYIKAETRRRLLAFADRMEPRARQHREEVAELERLRVQLAGCGVAAMSNTRESLARSQCVKPGDYGYSASYGDCVRAAEREIAACERAEAAEATLADARVCLGFFASVIKSGEPWTDICQQRYDAITRTNKEQP